MSGGQILTFDMILSILPVLSLKGHGQGLIPINSSDLLVSLC